MEKCLCGGTERIHVLIRNPRNFEIYCAWPQKFICERKSRLSLTICPQVKQVRLLVLFFHNI
jgi:hypothetical protein